jgi:hypothetical protein
MDHPEQAEVFNRAMSEVTNLMEPAVLAAYDFSCFRKIVDVGGGQGTLIGIDTSSPFTNSWCRH